MSIGLKNVKINLLISYIFVDFENFIRHIFQKMMTVQLKNVHILYSLQGYNTDRMMNRSKQKKYIGVSNSALVWSLHSCTNEK